ncbi:MAG TPA: hypothetical protein VGB20_01350 [bacterium]
MGETLRSSAGAKQGFLLVEAVLAAAVIALGLAVISRGLSGQLRALAALDAHEARLALARNGLLELERGIPDGQPGPAATGGAGAAPYEGYVWRVRAAQVEDLDEEAQPLSRVTVEAAPAGADRPITRLTAVWPEGMAPEEWAE